MLQIYYFLDSNKSNQRQGQGSYQVCTCIGIWIQASYIYRHNSWSYDQIRMRA